MDEEDDWLGIREFREEFENNKVVRLFRGLEDMGMRMKEHKEKALRILHASKREAKDSLVAVGAAEAVLWGGSVLAGASAAATAVVLAEVLVPAAVIVALYEGTKSCYELDASSTQQTRMIIDEP
ncbi:hypothetical protein LJ737_22690 [Hymenobacter sp. 15J16-1T3B]|uniref:hypothetical protein n=1 Tax=Hymenobacter sp. 15J16-1T3B TaxID=2886941 RepID=UPI001D0F9325|nr:hypothetical protein [Hymenobacter sp. 15J16-1T3B]MCC3160063.1 hypothetical protein [Hymenobacter sp. 15J16-1T3B]